MLDDPITPPVDPQAGKTEDPQPQAGNNPPDPQAGDGEEKLSIEEAKKLRSESHNLRKRLKELDASNNELKAFKEQIEAEKLSAEEKQQLAHKKIEQQLADIQKEKESALKQVQALRVNNEVFKHGQRLNIVDLDAATKLIDTSQIEYDESGNPSNIEPLLKELVKERSWLVGRQQQTSGGATNPSRSQSAGQPLTWDIISEMSIKDPAQYRARRAEIQQWMANNPTPR